jgi:signal recognition particle subunit SRP54
VRAVTGKPIKFAGTGEKLGDFEPFHPERMASRILGMGDVLTLIEKAAQMTEGMDSQSTQVDPTRMTLNDFLEQMQQLKKMGPLKNVLGMLPGIGTKIKNVEVDDDVLKKPEAIIRSMTLKERNNPSVLNASRRKRIAAGAGVTVQDVNQLMRQFDQMQTMMKQFAGKGRRFGKRKLPFNF